MQIEKSWKYKVSSIEKNIYDKTKVEVFLSFTSIIYFVIFCE